MSDSDPRGVLDAAAKLLSAKLRESPELRGFVNALGRWLIEEAAAAAQTCPADQPTQRESPAGQTEPPPEPPRDPIRDQTADSTRRAVAIGRLDAPAPAQIRGPREVPPPLTLGTEIQRVSAPAAPRPAPEDSEQASNELAVIVRRSRLKAESCRNFIHLRDARENAYHDPLAGERESEHANLMRSHIAQGKALDGCFLWVYWPHEAQPDDETILRIAECYDALADAAELTITVLPADPDSSTQPLFDAMQLLAEAHCMLRIALRPTWITSPDNDQNDAHYWLRTQTARRRILLPEYLRSDDVADPALAPDLRSRIAAVAASTQQARATESKITQHFRKIQWHARQILNAPDEDRLNDYAKIAAAIGSLIELGIAPGDGRFRDVIPHEVAATFPASQLPGAGADEVIHLVLRHTHNQDEDDAQTTEESDELERARELISGRAVVLIGGEPRGDAAARIERALGTTVLWPALSQHGSGEPMRAPINRPETAAIFVITRLTGHLHADEARQYATAAGKPCITLTHGYSPAQMARALLEQAEDRLASR